MMNTSAFKAVAEKSQSTKGKTPGAMLNAPESKALAKYVVCQHELEKVSEEIRQSERQLRHDTDWLSGILGNEHAQEVIEKYHSPLLPNFDAERMRNIHQNAKKNGYALLTKIGKTNLPSLRDKMAGR